MIRCCVRNRPPPLQYGHWATYLNPHGYVIGMTGSNSSSPSSTSSLPSASIPGVLSKQFFLFICGAFSPAGCLLPFFCQAMSCFSALPFLKKHFYSVHWPPVWLPRQPSHWSGSQTVPWPLVLRLLANAELQLYWTSLPSLIILRTIWSEWTRSRWSPWLASGCPLSA